MPCKNKQKKGYRRYKLVTICLATSVFFPTFNIYGKYGGFSERQNVANEGNRKNEAEKTKHVFRDISKCCEVQKNALENMSEKKTSISEIILFFSQLGFGNENYSAAVRPLFIGICKLFRDTKFYPRKTGK